ncbi:nitrate/nitrite transporter NrtS [Acidiphilium sp.]|uniref:nitrate/nitrite transporter NrtS n=1 Tax=Acidiphilium sp. TaxID=527 RepID=UPI003D049009
MNRNDLYRNCRYCVTNGVPRRSLVVAAVVGTILNLINQGDALWGSKAIDVTKLVLTFIVPYCVATYGAVSYRLGLDRAVAPVDCREASGDERITVVIPTLNEATHLPSLLADLATAPELIAAIVISDGGSSDQTVSIAAAAGAIIGFGDAGRGGQLRRGIAAAPTRWVLLLHADTSLPPGWAATILQRVTASDRMRAHYGRLRFASADPRARILEAGVRLRCALFRLPYGDQGLLIHRDLLDAIGGIPDLPLMEDVALARLLGRQRLAQMNLIVTTDASAYCRDGWFRRASRNLLRLARYYAGDQTVRQAADYHR